MSDKAQTESIDRWLARLTPEWRNIDIDPASDDGKSIYQLVRHGLAEVRCRFVLWHPDENHEFWCVASITGRWREARPPSHIKRLYGDKTPRLIQRHYLSLRTSPNVKLVRCDNQQFADPSTVAGVTGVSIPPIDREVTFEEDIKRVERIGLFYSPSQRKRGSRHSVPKDSYISCRLVQGEASAGRLVAANIAELEADYEPEIPATSSAIAFSFIQASYRWTEHLAAVRHAGKLGDLSSGDNALLKALGKSCLDLHNVGSAVVRMYHRNGRDATQIAELLADPLTFDSVDPRLIREIETIAFLDDACRPDPSSSGGSSESDAPDLRRSKNSRYDEEMIFGAIGRAGYYLETIVETCAKLDEEEIRDLLLLHLNGLFGAATSAEKFRKHGKTDLCLTFDEGDAFVAECKVWKGAKDCARALEQLLTYVTVRDHYAALIFFNKDVKNFSLAVSSVAADTLRKHVLFVQEATEGSIQHFRFRRNPGSDDLISIRLFTFDLCPTKRRTPPSDP